MNLTLRFPNPRIVLEFRWCCNELVKTGVLGFDPKPNSTLHPVDGICLISGVSLIPIVVSARISCGQAPRVVYVDRISLCGKRLPRKRGNPSWLRPKSNQGRPLLTKMDASKQLPVPFPVLDIQVRRSKTCCARRSHLSTVGARNIIIYPSLEHECYDALMMDWDEESRCLRFTCPLAFTWLETPFENAFD